MSNSVFYVGTPDEVNTHAAPLQAVLPELEIATVESVAQSARSGDLVIFYSEHFDRFRDLCIDLKSRRVPTLYAIDGILEWRNAWQNRADEIACPWTMRPCLSDVVAAIGPRQANVLSAWGNQGNVYNIGIPRLDDWAAAPRTSPSTSEWKILIATAKCPGFTEQQIQTTLTSLRALQRYFQNQPLLAGRPLRVTWRLTAGLDEQLGVESTTNRPLRQMLTDVDVVITTPSTLALEAMLMRRPTVLLDFHNTPDYVPAAWAIRHSDQIEMVLKDVASSDWESPRMAWQDFLLKEALRHDGNAAERMVQLIHETLERAEENRKSGEWSFDQLMIDSDSAPAFQTTSSEVFGPKSDSQRGGMTQQQWEAYAAQLKRENQRLTRLVEEAHKVFDHMQGHPLLGSILKTHQWIRETILKKPDPLKKPTEMENVGE